MAIVRRVLRPLGLANWYLGVVVCLLSWHPVLGAIYRAQTTDFYSMGSGSQVITDSTAINDDAHQHLPNPPGTSYVRANVVIPAGNYIYAVRVREEVAGSTGRFYAYWSGGSWASSTTPVGETYESTANRWHVVNGEVYGFRELASANFGAVETLNINVVANHSINVDEIWLYSPDEGFATKAEALASLNPGPSPIAKDVYRYRSTDFSIVQGNGGLASPVTGTEDNYFYLMGTPEEVGIAGVNIGDGIAAGQYQIGIRWRGNSAGNLAKYSIAWSGNSYTSPTVILPPGFGQLQDLRWFNFNGEIFEVQQYGLVSVGDVTSFHIEMMDNPMSAEIDEIIVFKPGQGYATQQEAMNAGATGWTQISAQLDSSTIPAKLIVTGTKDGQSVAHTWGYDSAGNWESIGDLTTLGQVEALDLILNGDYGNTVLVWESANSSRGHNPPVHMISEFIWAKVAYLRTSDPATYAVFDHSTVAQAMASQPDVVLFGDPMYGPAWRAYIAIEAGAE